MASPASMTAGPGTGNPGDLFRDTNHVYADDLDVFGRGSLFELIDAARTGAGERTLAGGYLHPRLAMKRFQAKCHPGVIESVSIFVKTCIDG